MMKSVGKSKKKINVCGRILISPTQPLLASNSRLVRNTSYIDDDAGRVEVFVLGLICWDVSVDLLVSLEPLHAVDGVPAEVVATNQGHLLALVDPVGTGNVDHLDAVEP